MTDLKIDDFLLPERSARFGLYLQYKRSVAHQQYIVSKRLQ